MNRRALLLGLACSLVACSKRSGELQLVDVKRGDLVIGVVVSGVLEAVDSTDIKPPPLDIWNFKIASLADDGADVKAGEPIVGFDASEQVRELETMQNEVEAAKKKLEKKQADIALARREEELAIATAEAGVRKSTLKTTAPTDLVATIDMKASQLDEKSAQVGLELQRNKANQARRTDEAELANLKEKLAYATGRAQELAANISKMEVKAPRTGTVIYPTGWRGEKRKVGDTVWRLEAVLQVVGLDKMVGKGEVDEVDIAKVAEKQVVTLRLDALPDAQLRGSVQLIARTVRPKSFTDPSKVVEVKVQLEPTKAPLRPGMRFRGEVETERIPNVLLLPVDAVFVTPAGPVAYRVRDGSTEAVKVVLGRRSATMVEVKSGLAADDRVSRIDPTGGSK